MHKVALPEKYVYGAVDFCRVNLDPMEWCVDRSPGNAPDVTFVFRNEESAVAFSARFGDEITEYKTTRAEVSQQKSAIFKSLKAKPTWPPTSTSRFKYFK